MFVNFEVDRLKKKKKKKKIFKYGGVAVSVCHCIRVFYILEGLI